MDSKAGGPPPMKAAGEKYPRHPISSYKTESEIHFICVSWQETWLFLRITWLWNFARFKQASLNSSKLSAVRESAADAAIEANEMKLIAIKERAKVFMKISFVVKSTTESSLTLKWIGLGMPRSSAGRMPNFDARKWLPEEVFKIESGWFPILLG